MPRANRPPLAAAKTALAKLVDVHKDEYDGYVTDALAQAGWEQTTITTEKWTHNGGTNG